MQSRRSSSTRSASTSRGGLLAQASSAASSRCPCDPAPPGSLRSAPGSSLPNLEVLQPIAEAHRRRGPGAAFSGRPGRPTTAACASRSLAQEALYVSKRGRLAGVLLDADRYGELIERLEFLEDSLAVLQARDERETAVPWAAVRE
jgi:hypothetical protein